MNREIKFRTWDEKYKCYAVQGEPDLETLQSFIHHYGDRKLEQYTGLKDKNGVEIFEGDVVEAKHQVADVKYNVTIEYIGCGFVAICDNRECAGFQLDNTAADMFKLEVIGNTHDNLGLIK